MPNRRQYSLDLLKGIAICLVIAWHLKPIDVELTSEAGPAGKALSLSLHIFYHEISLIAVPTFFVVSLLLFFHNASRRGGATGDRWGVGYLVARLERIALLYLFWVVVQTVFAAVAAGGLPALSIDFLWLGGPGLPVVGGSVFYFLFCLFILTLLAFAYGNLEPPKQKLVGIFVIGASGVFFEAALWSRTRLPATRMENFLIWVPLAHWLSQRRSTAARYRYLFLAGYLVFCVHDVLIEQWSSKLTVIYGRMSVIFGVLTLIAFVSRARLKERRAVQWLALYSLGLFAVHKYWQYLLLQVVALPIAPVELIGTRWDVNRFILATAAIVLTLISTKLFALTKLRRFFC